jgi:hypothetical protein
MYANSTDSLLTFTSNSTIAVEGNTHRHSVCLVYDPEPAEPKDVDPMAQCAFESFVFKVSAVHTNYRS